MSEGFDIKSNPWKVSRYVKTIQAEVTKLGEVGNREVYRAEPTDKPQWLLDGNDVVPLMGGSIITYMDLQDSESITLVMISDRAIVQVYGAKRRISDILFIKDGVVTDVPASVILALGLIPDAPKPVPVNAPPVFDLDSIDPDRRELIANVFSTAGIAR